MNYDFHAGPGTATGIVAASWTRTGTPWLVCSEKDDFLQDYRYPSPIDHHWLIKCIELICEWTITYLPEANNYVEQIHFINI